MKSKLKDAMKSRCARVLEIAKWSGITHLILGAFGCGVFLNDPNDMCTIFQKFITNHLFELFERSLICDPWQ